MIFGLLLAACLVAWLIRRRGRRDTLAGRNHARPIYSVEPAARRVGSRRTEGL